MPNPSGNIQVNRLEHGISELVFNAQYAKVNKLDQHTLLELAEIINSLAADPSLQGLLLRSAKNSFIVGADITEFLDMFAFPPEQLKAWLNQANAIFNQLEDLKVPTISAINGYALGGGCELILSTDLRIATPDAVIGLPETKLGIMPGFGGTVRLPRLIGADNAMEWISLATNHTAAQCLKVGAIDAISTLDQLNNAALRMLQQAIEGKLDWQQRKRAKQGPLLLSTTEAKMSFTVAKSMVAVKAGPHYPAPLTAIKTIEHAAQLQRNDALDLETKHFIQLAHSPTATALVGVFLNDQYVKSVAKQHHAKPIKQAAVIGAGIMGGGIAYQSASRGTPVILKDIHSDALKLGLDQANKLLNQQRERGRIDGITLGEIISAITPSLDYSALHDCEIAIEAVVENPKIKGQVLQELETKINSEAVIVSNTSSIPIALLAEGLQRPSNFCGMHFFNPVHKMPLVEVIKTPATSSDTVNKVVSYAKQMGKTPIVVNDCPGFFVNRVLFPYFFAFNRLLQDGIDFCRIDNLMEQTFGWPMGPAYLLDVVGIDTAHHASQVMTQGYSNRMQQQGDTAIDALYHAKRFGQKNNLGFYRYLQAASGNKTKQADNQVKALLEPSIQTKLNLDDEAIVARMLIPMINEVVLCLEEGIIQSPSEADTALIYGLGFPPFRGGVFRYLDQLGLNNYLKMCKPFLHLGPLYQPSQVLSAKASAQQYYYR